MDKGAEFVAKVSAAVRAFEAFGKDNDPWQEHDFASLEVEGETVMFKIDYYDANMEYGSPDPSDPRVTARVMTIMLAQRLLDMADDCTVPRAALRALREELRERAKSAHYWFEELTGRAPEPMTRWEAQQRMAELGLFLIEMAGDLQDWQKSLGACIGRKSPEINRPALRPPVLPRGRERRVPPSPSIHPDAKKPAPSAVVSKGNCPAPRMSCERSRCRCLLHARYAGTDSTRLAPLPWVASLLV